MSKGTLGSWEGMVTPDKNMLKIFRENELAINPYSIIKFTDMSIIKLGVIADPGTVFFINGERIVMATNVFELGLGIKTIKSLMFTSAVYAQFAFMY